MRILFSITILVIVVLVQSSLFPLLFSAAIPHLLLVYVLTHRSLHPSRTVVINILIGGLFLDLVQGNPLGLTSLLLLFIILISYLFSQSVRFSFIQILSFTFFSSFVFRTVLMFSQVSWQQSLEGAASDVVMLLILYPLFWWGHRVLTGNVQQQMTF